MLDHSAHSLVTILTMVVWLTVATDRKIRLTLLSIIEQSH
jgi:hypothetical protein